MMSSIDDILNDLRLGKMVIVIDDEDRENEGDLVISAEKITPGDVAFMATHGRGLICMPIAPEDAIRLSLTQMVEENTEHFGTAFTVSIDAKDKTSTGISAFDRSHTIRHAADPTSRPEDFVRPGHIFPLVSKPGGVLKRAGHTEAVVDLMRLSGLRPVGVLCEIMKDDGTMARLDDLKAFAETHAIRMVTIADLIRYRRERDALVRRIAETELPSKYGTFRAIAFEDTLRHDVHLALVKGDITGSEPVLCRMHSECLTGDVLGSLRCDCGEQLAASLKTIEAEGRGVLVYLRQEGRGIGLGPKIQAYALQEEGLDTVEANQKLGYAPDLRDYGIGAQILVSLGVKNLALMTNNPKKIAGLEGYGLKVAKRVPIEIPSHPENRRYLETKKTKLGHIFHEV